MNIIWLVIVLIVIVIAVIILLAFAFRRDNNFKEELAIGTLKGNPEKIFEGQFNPSMVTYKGDIVMSTRSVIKGVSYLNVYVNPGTDKEKVHSHQLFEDTECHFKGIEDVRLFTFQNQLWGIGNFCDVSNNCLNRMVLLCLKGDRIAKKVSLFLKEGGEPKVEKNWAIFDYNEELYFEYSLSPHHKVYKINIDSGECTMMGLTPVKLSIPETPHLTTLPLKIKGGMLGIAHIRRGGHYVHCLYIFEDKPPFSVKWISKLFRLGSGQKIEYISGAHIDRDKVLSGTLTLTYGVGDNLSYRDTFDLETLVSSWFTNLPLLYTVDAASDFPVYLISINPPRAKLTTKRMLTAGLKNVILSPGIKPDVLEKYLAKWNIKRNIHFGTGQKCCTAAHLETMDLILTKNYKAGLIAEDDVIFPTNFSLLFDRIVCQAPRDYDILYIGWQQSSPIKEDSPFIKHHPHCTHFYIINKKGIRKIFDHIKKHGIDRTIDIFIVDLGKKIGLKSYCVNPKYFEPTLFKEGKPHPQRADGIVHQDENLESQIHV